MFNKTYCHTCRSAFPLSTRYCTNINCPDSTDLLSRIPLNPLTTKTSLCIASLSTIGAIIAFSLFIYYAKNGFEQLPNASLMNKELVLASTAFTLFGMNCYNLCTKKNREKVHPCFSHFIAPTLLLVTTYSFALTIIAKAGGVSFDRFLTLSINPIPYISISGGSILAMGFYNQVRKRSAQVQPTQEHPKPPAVVHPSKPQPPANMITQNQEQSSRFQFRIYDPSRDKVV